MSTYRHTDLGALIEPPAVLHVAGRVTEAVFSLLGPLTHQLQRSGVPQTVVLLDAPDLAYQTARFSDAVNLLPIAPARPGWKHWLELRQAVRRQLAESPPSTVHFHGLKPWLMASDLARAAGIRVCLSPHGASWYRHLASRLGGARGDVTVAMGSDDPLLVHDGVAGHRCVDGAVDGSFFEVERREARRPLIVAGCHLGSRKAIELFSRMAVIFGAAELDLAFNWFGPVAGASQACLKAAGVGTYAPPPDASLASRLAAGWVFVACGGERVFPVRLAEAMAVGLPCLVADVPAYRTLVQDGRNALVYHDEEQALELLTTLIDTPALRARLGAEARSEAQRRFTGRRLGDELAPLYLADRATALQRIAA